MPTSPLPPQGRDAGGGGRDVEAGRHAGARARGGAPGGAARVVVGAVPGRGVRRDDVLPPAEPVPAVPGVPGRLRPGAAHRQRLPHRALPGPRRRPAAHEGRQVGGRQAHPRRPHRQHRGPLPGTYTPITLLCFPLVLDLHMPIGRCRRPPR